MANKETERRECWLKENGPCSICGSSIELHIHHVNPNETLSHRFWGWSEEKRNKELEKCIVLCKECHVDIHTKMKREGKQTEYNKERKLIDCIKCGRKRPLGSKNLCKTCYRENQRNNTLIICSRCGKEKKKYVDEICNACYSKERRANPPKRKIDICIVCKEEKYIEGFRMCMLCYKKDYNVNRRKIIICRHCGEEKKHHCDNLCSKCYMQIKRASEKNS
jgi:hypothetical protein